MRPGDGGDAFPNNFLGSSTQGMSLRDYFAAHAMQGMLSSKVDAKLIATRAFLLADAMLEARGEQV